MTQQPDMTYTPRREPVAECHNPHESQIAERAYTAEQEARMYASERAPEPINDYAARRGE